MSDKLVTVELDQCDIDNITTSLKLAIDSAMRKLRFEYDDKDRLGQIDLEQEPIALMSTLRKIDRTKDV